jgi:hypothetical protein
MRAPRTIGISTSLALTAGLFALAALGGRAAQTPPAETPPATPEAAPAPPAETAPAPPFDQDAAVAQLRKAIAGRENEPAEKVFKDIQMMKGVPAGRLLAVMENGFGPALGVDCRFCHDPAGWEKDAKHKQVAREMMKMSRAINQEYLAKIEHLDENPAVNCTTCHRGEKKPALDLPAAPAGSS